MLPNNNYVVRKIGTNKTQFLHRMRLRQFAPRQPIPDIPITPREWQPDPKVVITHDDLYARAWECEYDEPIFDSDYNNLATPSPPENTIRSEQAADEMRNTPGIIPENSPEIVLQPDRSYDWLERFPGSMDVDPFSFNLVSIIQSGKLSHGVATASKTTSKTITNQHQKVFTADYMTSRNSYYKKQQDGKCI